MQIQSSDYQTCAVRPNISISVWDILSSLPNALVILNAEGRMVWLNPPAEAMLGYGLIGTLWQDVLSKAFMPKDDDGHEMSLADGRRVHMAMASLESLPGMLITLSDVTATRDYEKEKEDDKRLMTIGTMTAQLAHQIRTPLASAILYTEHLNNYQFVDERASLWFNRLHECHASIEQQIQDLLLFARGTSIQLEMTNLDNLCTLISQRAQPHIEFHKAELTINNLVQAKDAFIHGEALIGAILNLVINALQSESTKINIMLASTDHSGIQISVEDNGKGMTEEVKNQAILPFFTTKARGTGLGLAVVFAVLKAHGGKVSLESVVDVGTQVNLYLPGNNKTPE